MSTETRVRAERRFGRARTWDVVARTVVIALFAFFAFANVAAIREIVLRWPETELLRPSLAVLAKVANALFLALVAATTVTRLRPIRKAEGIQPRVSALLGTFLLTTLALLAPAPLSPSWSAASSLLTIAGALASFAVLRWLGRSFSIMAEARALVTSGPYAIVRHPLYVTESLAALGILIQVFSPLALLIFAVQLGFQYQRIRNEENVLRAAFPDYGRYAAVTPQLVPALGSAWLRRNAPPLT